MKLFNKNTKILPVCLHCCQVLENVNEIQMHKHPNVEFQITNQKLFYLICCEFCTKTYKNSSALNIHRQLHKTNKNGELIQCIHCQCKYDQNKLINHQHLMHSSRSINIKKYRSCEIQRFYNCDYGSCSDLFSYWSELSNHKNYHNKGYYKPKSKPEDKTCHQCKRSFTQIYNLRRHMLLHNDAKKHEKFVATKTKIKDKYVNKLKTKNFLQNSPTLRKEKNLTRLKSPVNYYCEICDRIFFSHSKYKHHFVV